MLNVLRWLYELEFWLIILIWIYLVGIARFIQSFYNPSFHYTVSDSIGTWFSFYLKPMQRDVEIWSVNKKFYQYFHNVLAIQYPNIIIVFKLLKCILLKFYMFFSHHKKLSDHLWKIKSFVVKKLCCPT